MLKVTVVEKPIPNEHAQRLGSIARDAYETHRSATGDFIDLGLILVRKLRENGYSIAIVEIEEES